jgi:putative tryptophan/tyrosine transport system substrate-binding protein
MKRREFISLIGGATAWPLAARAQRLGKTPRIGILMAGLAFSSSLTTLDAFQQGLRERGRTEGLNIAIEYRYGEWRLSRLADLASELVALKVDVIVAFSTLAARAAQQATSTIPIVAAAMGDPEADGLIASLARPGGNITGTTFLGPELVPKRLQLLREIIPGLSRVAALWHPRAYGERTMEGVLKETEVAAATLGLQLELVPVFVSSDFDSAFSVMARQRADALIVLPSPMLYTEHKRIVALAASSRLPAMYQAREFVEAGGLMSYGANVPALFRRAATYVDKVLMGEKPADLPVEQPTKFELIINLKTAKALELEVPLLLQQFADEVIE